MRLKLIFLSLFVCVFAATAWSQNAVVTGQDAFLRGTPAETGAVVDTLAVGAKVYIIKEAGEWYLVQSSPFVGWMPSSSLKKAATSSASPAQLPASARLENEPNSATPLKNPKGDISASPPSETSGERVYKRGPRGGCYYVQQGGKKKYVAHRFCSQEDKTNSD